MATDIPAVTPSANNGFLNSFNELFGTISGAAEKGVNIYSNFLGAKSAAKLANSQLVAPPYTPDTNQDGIFANNSKLITYGGITIAVVLTGLLLFKVIK